MKIEARRIKPGMVISDLVGKNRDWTSISLVTAIKGGLDEIAYTHFNYNDAIGGQMVGFLKPKHKVKVITGKKREKIIKHILGDVYRDKQYVDQSINTIRLIMAMDKD